MHRSLTSSLLKKECSKLTFLTRRGSSVWQQLCLSPRKLCRIWLLTFWALNMYQFGAITILRSKSTYERMILCMSKKKSFWLGDEKCRSSNAMKYQFMILINLLLGSTHKTGRSIDVNITSEVVHDSEQSKDLLSCEWIFSAGNLGYSTGIQLCTKKSP